MKIVVRAAGERTEKKCIRLAKKQGQVHVIRAVPFGEAVRQTYLFGKDLNQKWLPVVDADVQLYPGVLRRAISRLNQLPNNLFCLDGKTDDKIFLQKRRAGIHIYRVRYLKKALRFIDNNHIKPESRCRRAMNEIGFKTHTGKVVFGKHDYDQYYRDLWRKAVCQTRKLAGKIRKYPGIKKKWREMSKSDIDFFIIYYAHFYGMKYVDKILIDCRLDFEAEKYLKKLGIVEKGLLK